MLASARQVVVVDVNHEHAHALNLSTDSYVFSFTQSTSDFRSEEVRPAPSLQSNTMVQIRLVNSKWHL